ncbi:hypothetical protein BH23GEM2_BH23GEM2_24120 [soil metagenome]
MQTSGHEGHMRRVSTIVAGFAAAALLAGCATSYQPALHGSDGNLHARIYQPTSGTLQFAVSQPAYVAVFAILPGGGATLLHPTTQGEARRQISPGVHSYLGSGMLQSRLFHAGGSSFYGSSIDGPTTLILIASSEPLNVTRLMRYPTLGGDLRLASFYSHASEHAVLRLAELIMPDPATTDWTYDTYTLWPSQSGTRMAAGRVICADGRVVLVRGAYPVGCREGSGQSPPASSDTVSVPPADTGRVAPPKRPRAPVEPSARKPDASARPQARAVREAASDGARRSQPRKEQARESQARESQGRGAPRPRAQTAPARERPRAEPATQKAAERSERSRR